MNTFENLSKAEQQEFLKFPVYISLLAANKHGITNEQKKSSAIDFDHTKTFSCDPMLVGFFEKADKVFKSNLTKLDNELPKGQIQRETAIMIALEKLEELLLKFGKKYANTMHQSMKSFKDHVSTSEWNILDSFIFPVPIKGITY